MVEVAGEGGPLVEAPVAGLGLDLVEAGEVGEGDEGTGGVGVPGLVESAPGRAA